MKRIVKWSILLLVFVWIWQTHFVSVVAAQVPTIRDGVYVESVDLSGKTQEQAMAALERYIEKLKDTPITLQVADQPAVSVPVGALGMVWENPEIVEEIVTLAQKGNIIQRYKLRKDLEQGHKVFSLTFDFDKQVIRDVLYTEFQQYTRQEGRSALKRENSGFRVMEGKSGYVLHVEDSVNQIYAYLTQDWDRKAARIELPLVMEDAQDSANALRQVGDLLGTFTTSYTTSSASRCANVENGCKKIDGTILYPGDEFSTYAAVAPFTTENGYHMAGSYYNGEVVNSLGGGICQVSTTLYNAVLLAELEVTERHNHSMVVDYVEPSQDAAIAESAGKDFKFRNNLEHPVYIEGILADHTITINIYGKETRDRKREVSYESDILQVNQPKRDKLVADSSHAIGYFTSDNAHIGYQAKLMKIVKENGVEVSRTQVNSSSYQMVPRTIKVGVATDDKQAKKVVMSAIRTGDLAQVRDVVDRVLSGEKLKVPDSENVPDRKEQQAAGEVVTQEQEETETVTGEEPQQPDEETEEEMEEEAPVVQEEMEEEAQGIQQAEEEPQEDEE